MVQDLITSFPWCSPRGWGGGGWRGWGSAALCGAQMDVCIPRGVRRVPPSPCPCLGRGGPAAHPTGEQGGRRGSSAVVLCSITALCQHPGWGRGDPQLWCPLSWSGAMCCTGTSSSRMSWSSGPQAGDASILKPVQWHKPKQNGQFLLSSLNAEDSLYAENLVQK